MRNVLIIFFILFFAGTAYDNSKEIIQFLNLLDINKKWAEYWFKHYKLYNYIDDITRKRLVKKNVVNLALAIMKWESGCNNNQIVWENKVKGYSYGQYGLLSTTAKSYGWNGKDPKELLNPEINAKYAIKFLCIQLHKYNGNIDEALAAYNAGKCRYKNGYIRNNYYVENVYRLYQKANKYGSRLYKDFEDNTILEK